MPVGVTEISRTVYDLHMLILWICVVIGIVVFGAIIYSVIYHRKSRGAVAAEFHESTTVEMVWTVVPFIILVAMAVPAAKTLVAMEHTGDSDLSVKVTAYQWKWHYEYLDEDISFFSTLSTPREQIFDGADKGENYLVEVDNPMVVPVGKKVRMLLTANDVIHAWWVPDLAVKKDAIPRLHKRSMDSHRRTRHLPRKVCRTVRPRPRLHADRGGGEVRSRVCRLGGEHAGRGRGRRRRCGS